MSITIRYVLVPDWVYSQTDYNRHYINAGDLAHLYGVPIRECIIRQSGDKRPVPKGLIWLYPRHDGKYERLTS